MLQTIILTDLGKEVYIMEYLVKEAVAFLMLGAIIFLAIFFIRFWKKGEDTKGWLFLCGVVGYALFIIAMLTLFGVFASFV